MQGPANSRDFRGQGVTPRMKHRMGQFETDLLAGKAHGDSHGTGHPELSAHPRGSPRWAASPPGPATVPLGLLFGQRSSFAPQQAVILWDAVVGCSSALAAVLGLELASSWERREEPLSPEPHGDREHQWHLEQGWWGDPGPVLPAGKPGGCAAQRSAPAAGGRLGEVAAQGRSS